MAKSRITVTETIAKVAAVFHQKLQGSMTDQELQQAWNNVSQIDLGPSELKEIRDLVSSMRKLLMDRLTDELGRGNDAEPPPRIIRAALESAGYPANRNATLHIQKQLRAKYGARWEASKNQKRYLRAIVTEGERELFESLRKTYDMDNSALFAMLLRTFAVAASTSRIDYVETPSLAVTISDDDLRRYARSLNFRVTLRRRV